MIVPSKSDILTRLVLLLHLPHTFTNLGKNLLDFLPLILPIINSDIRLDTQQIQ